MALRNPQTPNEYTYHINNCPLEKIVHILDSKWTLFILLELQKNNASFNQLKKILKPITSKTLSAVLHKCLEKEFIQKKDLTYSITEKGKELLSRLTTIKKKHPSCEHCRGKETCLP